METVSLEFAAAESGVRVATLRLDRPAARNALNDQMCRDLLEALRGLREAADVACVLVRGVGPVFCAGADLKERKGMDDDRIRGRRLRAFRAYDAIEALPMPAVAVVHGPCIGSGCEIAAACDFIVAGRSASFRYPETRWGTVGATQRLPRIVGRRLAKELMFTGRAVDAEEARAIGLVNRVVDDDALDAEVAALAAQIAAAPLSALRLAKRTIDRGVDDSRAGALAGEILAIEENLDEGAWRERMGGTGGAVGGERA